MAFKFSWVSLLKISLLLLLIGAIIVACFTLPVEKILKDFLVWIEQDLGPWGPLVLAVAYIPLTVLAVPASVLTLHLEAFRAGRMSLHCDRSLGVKVGDRDWHALPMRSFRVDVDADVNWNNHSFGVGVVIRDWKGDLCAALAMPLSKPSSVHDAEISAAIYGLRLCYQEGCGPVDLFSDSLSAVRHVRKVMEAGETDEEEILVFVQATLDEVISDCFHMFRSANVVSHSLACFGACSDRMYSWNTGTLIFLLL